MDLFRLFTGHSQGPRKKLLSRKIFSLIDFVHESQKNVNLSTEREFIHTMDNCLWHGQAMKCPLTVYIFVSLIVSDQNCPRDLDLSRKILTSLTHFLGPCHTPATTFLEQGFNDTCNLVSRWGQMENCVQICLGPGPPN